jgi:hypothetical protein
VAAVAAPASGVGDRDDRDQELEEGEKGGHQRESAPGFLKGGCEPEERGGAGGAYRWPREHDDHAVKPGWILVVLAADEAEVTGPGAKRQGEATETDAREWRPGSDFDVTRTSRSVSQTSACPSSCASVSKGATTKAANR